MYSRLLTWCFFLFAEAILLASTEPVSFITGSPPTAPCTGKLNSWGWPDACPCARLYRYQPSMGLCVSEKQVIQPSSVRGKLQGGFMAIGGETSGYILKTSPNQEELEVVFKQEDFGKISAMVGQFVKITGFKFVPHGVERKNRRAILVKAMAPSKANSQVTAPKPPGLQKQNSKTLKKP